MSLPYEGHQEYPAAVGLMETMVATSQRPSEECRQKSSIPNLVGPVDDQEEWRPESGNLDFVEAIGEQLSGMGIRVDTVDDPEYGNRQLLIATFGDPKGEQILAGISHSDVVGVQKQEGWDNKSAANTLTERGGLWIGRGVADTHGSGVAMLCAGNDRDLIYALQRSGKNIAIVFTYDEEAQDSLMSFRGARVAAGLEGNNPVITADYFIAGEPTEVIDGDGMIPRHTHKGRWLFGYEVVVDGAGHAAENSRNAATHAFAIGNQVSGLSRRLESADYALDTTEIFDPPYSTAQITGGDMKGQDFSTTLDRMTVYVDLRTIPGFHARDVKSLNDLIVGYALGRSPDVTLRIKIIDNFVGTGTPKDSPIVIASEEATGHKAIGFNGGDEGAILRGAGHRGVTLGPGAMSEAHSPNEQIKVSSVLNAVGVYRDIFWRVLQASS